MEHSTLLNILQLLMMVALGAYGGCTFTRLYYTMDNFKKESRFIDAMEIEVNKDDLKEEIKMGSVYYVKAVVYVNFDGYYGAEETYVLGHSQSRMIADSYAAKLNKELGDYLSDEDKPEYITPYRFLWGKGIITSAQYEYYKRADEVTVDFVVEESKEIDTDLDNVEVCEEVKHES